MGSFTIALFVIICVLLVVVVLLQKGRGGGFSGLFGGSGSAFGTRTGDVFTWVTIVLAGLFLLLAVVASLTVRPPKVALGVPRFRVVASPADGDVWVSILPPDARGEIDIHYTTDGATPTRQSSRYQQSPLKLTPPVMVKAIAFKPGSESAVAELPVGMDPSPDTSDDANSLAEPNVPVEPVMTDQANDLAPAAADANAPGPDANTTVEANSAAAG